MWRIEVRRQCVSTYSSKSNQRFGWIFLDSGIRLVHCESLNAIASLLNLTRSKNPINSSEFLDMPWIAQNNCYIYQSMPYNNSTIACKRCISLSTSSTVLAWRTLSIICLIISSTLGFDCFLLKTNSSASSFVDSYLSIWWNDCDLFGGK